MMTWLIILLILAVVIGPVMYLVPTAADRRLTALRAKARSKGLDVQITSVPKLDPTSDERVTAGGKQLDPKIACTAYRLPLGDNLSQSGTLMWLKLPPHPTVLVNEVAPGWALQADSDAALWQRFNGQGKGVETICGLEAALPDGVLGLAMDDRYVSCYWREKATAEDGAVERIAAALASLRDDLIARI